MEENPDHPASEQIYISGSGPLAGGRAITKLPAQDLDRARAFYQDKLGLAPVEEREGGLRYLCAAGEFHLFLSTGAASGTFTQMGFEVENIEAVVADLRSRGVVFETFDLELARIGSLLFIFADSSNDQIGSSSPIDTYATRLSAQPLIHPSA
jgi:catechol 2,3-dioxygenase-like lactoylglutathione lyase family enzyme